MVKVEFLGPINKDTMELKISNLKELSEILKNDDYKNLSADVKKYEPKIALASGEDGLACIEKLIESVLKIKKKYKQKIYVFIEADPDQMDKIKILLRKNFNNSIINISKDLSQKERIISVKIA